MFYELAALELLSFPNVSQEQAFNTSLEQVEPNEVDTVQINSENGHSLEFVISGLPVPSEDLVPILREIVISKRIRKFERQISPKNIVKNDQVSRLCSYLDS